ncbi:hypothetical protein OH76DRAFT_1420896 [Lentinus brumalis]|uniref:Uncharacterized protein n=1 Tax=Lentinus brumalis TaxID=2498619 RepID=A0A371CYC0_9APHY|nr:hypothetical protein OH76DRAFT_1420896 [Polyporus brumalis]
MDARTDHLLTVIPTDINVAELIAFARDAQVVMSDLKDRCQQLEFKASAKEDNKCAKCGAKKRTKLVPPPELADKEEEVKEAGREYALTYVPWPPEQAFHLQVVPDDIDPDNYEQRYPRYGDKALALVTARAKELHNYLPPPLDGYIRNKWFKSVFSLGVNSHRCHMLMNCKESQAAIFAHIPDLTTNLEFWRGKEGSKDRFPPIFYPNGDTSQVKFLLRSQALLNVLRICNFGKGALAKNHVPRSNSTAKLWGIDTTSIGMIAMGIVFVRYLLSCNAALDRRGNWVQLFDDCAQFLMQKRDLPSVRCLFAWFDYRLFSKAGADGGDGLPLEHAPGDDWLDDAQYSGLNQQWDAGDLVSDFIIQDQASVEVASAILGRARDEELSRALHTALQTVQAQPQVDRDDSGTATPSTRPWTPMLSPTVTPPAPGQPGRVTIGETDFEDFQSVVIPEDVESISTALSRPLPAARVPAPAAPGQTRVAMDPPPRPVQVAAIPAARSATTGARERPQAVAIPVPGPSQPAVAVEVPIPVVDAPKPKPKPRPRGRNVAKTTAEESGKGKARSAAAEDGVPEKGGRVLRPKRNGDKPS